MRINARLDQISSDQLTYIQQITNQGITDVIKSSISLYYQKIQQESNDSKSKLKQSGFIGCGEAEPELSATYKSTLNKQNIN